MQRENCCARYPLNATLWWLIGSMVVANRLSRSGAVCVRDAVNALMTAGQLINWGMPTLATEMLTHWTVSALCA
ncbi:hypothetical protein ACLK19_16950 [Escherichia coli]